MREFTASTEPLRSGDGEDLTPFEFRFQGQEFTLIPPGEAELAYLMAASASSRSEGDKVAAIIDFFDQALPPAQRPEFTRLLFAAKADGFSVLTQIFREAIGEWTGRPTGSASA